MVLRFCLEGEVKRSPPPPHRLDEFRLAIPWQVAPQQSPPPLHQLPRLCNSEAVDSIYAFKHKPFRLDFYVRQRIPFHLDLFVSQYVNVYLPNTETIRSYTFLVTRTSFKLYSRISASLPAWYNSNTNTI